MTLQESIDALALHAASTHRLRDWEPELRLVLDAARAFSCKECRGTGRIHVAIADTTIDCRHCRDARLHLRGNKK